jgi:hypothetical protein
MYLKKIEKLTKQLVGQATEQNYMDVPHDDKISRCDLNGKVLGSLVNGFH